MTSTNSLSVGSPTCPDDGRYLARPIDASLPKRLRTNGHVCCRYLSTTHVDRPRPACALGENAICRFDLNDYSIPHSLVREPLVLIASPTTVRLTTPRAPKLPDTTEATTADRSSKPSTSPNSLA